MASYLRLDPRRRPLWRDQDTLQLGLDDPVLVPDPAPWQLQFLRALEFGVPPDHIDRTAAACGVTAVEAEDLLALIAPALDTSPEPFDLTVRALPAAMDRVRAAALADALEAAGARITADRGPVVIVTPHSLLPRTAAGWLSDDRVHLPVVVDTDGITVGPVIVPGLTACASCLTTERTAANPAYPALMAQLQDRPPRLPGIGRYARAGELAVRLLRTRAEQAEWDDISSAVSVTASRESWRTHRPRADCGCRSPEGIETACAPAVRLPEPRTATPMSRPA